VVEREPPPIVNGQHLLFPDVAVERGGARRFVEVLGFATREYVATKLDRYRQAGIADAVLCVDLANAQGCEAESQICRFTRFVAVDDLIAALEGGIQ